MMLLKFNWLFFFVVIRRSHASIRVSSSVLGETDRSEDVHTRVIHSSDFQSHGSHLPNAQDHGKPSLDTITRHRELFSQDFLCGGITDGIIALVGAILSLITFGLIQMPGHGGDGGKGKGYRRLSRHRNRRETSSKLRMLQDREYLETLSESEAKDLVHKMLKELEWNEEENPDLHGRKLFNILELLGLVNCSPPPPNVPQCGGNCPEPVCVEDIYSQVYQTYECIENECVLFSTDCSEGCCVDATGCTSEC